MVVVSLLLWVEDNKDTVSEKESMKFEQIILNQAKHDMFQSCSHSEHDNVQSHLTGLTFLDNGGLQICEPKENIFFH